MIGEEDLAAESEMQISDEFLCDAVERDQLSGATGSEEAQEPLRARSGSSQSVENSQEDCSSHRRPAAAASTFQHPSADWHNSLTTENNSHSRKNACESIQTRRSKLNSKRSRTSGAAGVRTAARGPPPPPAARRRRRHRRRVRQPAERARPASITRWSV